MATRWRCNLAGSHLQLWPETDELGDGGGSGCSETKSSVLSCCFGAPSAQTAPRPGWGACFSCSGMLVLVVTPLDFSPALGGWTDTCLRSPAACSMAAELAPLLLNSVSSRTGSLVTEELSPLGLGKGGPSGNNLGGGRSPQLWVESRMWALFPALALFPCASALRSWDFVTSPRKRRWAWGNEGLNGSFLSPSCLGAERRGSFWALPSSLPASHSLQSDIKMVFPSRGPERPKGPN